MLRYMTLIFLWGAWCFFHSFLITPSVTGYFLKRFGEAYRYYRIFYNFVALVTLIPVWAYSFTMKGLTVFHWEGMFRIAQGLMVISAYLFFIGGAKRYDLAQFLGVRKVREDSVCSVLTNDCRLDTGGVLGMVRHPWYTGGILAVWARSLDKAAILTNLIITVYFFVGAVIEERKLLAEFGEKYVDYQRRVSMFFPLKWIVIKLRGEQDESLKGN
jgi:protein-S-isoprenylcysteine O-methyltransferase Ste14